jgi:predicted porin
MKKFVFAGIALALSCVAAQAASVTNQDSATIVVVVVEGDNRMEVALEPGQTADICPSGCFITTPSGDRLGLSGSENVQISNGSAIVQ